MPTIAPGAAHMPRSGIRRVMDAAWASGQPFIGMHVGEPNFAPPDHVVEAARDAYSRGETHYVPNAGIAQLRSAIATKLRIHNGIDVSDEQIVVTAGGAQALHLAFTLALSPGDEVLIPDPGWPNFAMAVELLGAVAVRYRLDPENDFMPRLDELESLLTPRTRLLLVNSPSNPLGTVIPAHVVESLVRFAERHDIWLLSDECYDALTYGATHTSPAVFDTSGVVLSAFSFSKTYAMTGLRVGYLVAPKEVAATMAKLQEPMISCVNAPAQFAALAALTGPQDHVDRMRESYAARGRLAMEALHRADIPYLQPHGAFYIWVDLTELAHGSVEEFTMDLLEREQVAIAPGTAFGAGGEGWARLSIAADSDAIVEGIARIGAMR